MNEVRFTFASFTYAGKAKSALSRRGIKSKLIKLGPDESDTGCTHGLLLDGENFFGAVKVLREEKIAYRVIDKTL